MYGVIDQILRECEDDVILEKKATTKQVSKLFDNDIIYLSITYLILI